MPGYSVGNGTLISIFTLQSNESSKAGKGQRTSIMDLQAIKTLKSDIPGNNRCVDCDAPRKTLT